MHEILSSLFAAYNPVDKHEGLTFMMLANSGQYRMCDFHATSGAQAVVMRGHMIVALMEMEISYFFSKGIIGV